MVKHKVNYETELKEQEERKLGLGRKREIIECKFIEWRKTSTSALSMFFTNAITI